MDKTLGFKLGWIFILVVVLMIALSSIGRLVTERQTRRDGVIQDIARSSSSAQQLAGPVLIVPYDRTLQNWVVNDRGERHLEEQQVSGQLHFLPETFRLEGAVQTERRARGIYEARLYHANLRIRSEFAVPAQYAVAAADLASYRFGQAFITVGVSDIRGIGSPLKATLNEAPVQLLPGAGTELVRGGFHVDVASVSPGSASHVTFAVDLPLLGTSQLQIVPVGRETQVALKSNWPDPSFTGDFLPVHHTIDAGGFTADWATSFFSTNLEEELQGCGNERQCASFTAQPLGVSFLDPVDQYLKTDRAIKYALLFILLTFAGFFLFDVLKRLPVHPMQYGLVGAALALFYLLLLSLSEHVGFGPAYLLSAAACAGLIAFYVSHVLRSAARGIGFALGLSVLYACLFGLLAADDYALLMGSLLLFALLTAVMFITRHVDWSKLGARELPAATTPALVSPEEPDSTPSS